MSRALATARGWLIASLALMAAGAVAHGAEAVSAGDYRVTVNDEGRMAIKHGRVPLVTTSYIGMFDRLPSGSLVYYVDSRRELRCEKTGEEAAPTLILHNAGMRGVAMRREIAASPEGVTLVHDITVPLGVAGAVDTGFTLNPELVFGARVTCWPRGSNDPLTTKLGAEPDALPYSSALRKMLFESEWGKLSIEFRPGDRTQDYGALLNGEQSTKRKGLWAQVLPLSQGATADKALEAHKSVCVIRYEPTPGKAFLPAQRNCLYNGGFEDWANADLPDGWRRSPHAERDTSAGLAPDSSARFEGKRSLRWALDAGELTHVISYRGYALPATLEAPCTFSVHVKSEPPGVRVGLRCGHGREVVTASGQWQRFAVTATRGNSFPVAIEKLSAGALWLDAAQLEEGSQPTPFVARDKSSLAGHTPFPSDLMKGDLEELERARPALTGCGPTLSYYTTESTGRLVYQAHLDAARGANARVAVALAGPDGRALQKAEIRPSPSGQAVLEFDPARLPVGATQASATLLLDGQTLATLKDQVIKLPALDRGVEVKVDRLARVLVRRGQPYVPVGSDTGTSVERALESVRGQAANGFNHVHLWAGFYEQERTPNGRVPRLKPDDLRAILDAAHDAGMTVTVNLSHWLMINRYGPTHHANKDVTDDEILKRTLEVVRLFRSHPALLTWHLSDEPSPAECPPAWLDRAYELVKEADPYHLAELNVCSSGRQMLSYMAASDLMSIDIYPVPEGHVGVVGPHTRFMWQAGGWRPVRWWIQAWPSVREPTAAEQTCMTYQALVEGTRFVLFYNYRPTSYQAWAGLGQLAAEIRALLPALTSADGGVVAVRGDQGRVTAAFRRAGAHAYVMAVNRDTQPVDAELSLPADCRGPDAEVLFESRRLPVQASTIRDRFEPMARHVYRVAAVPDH